MTAVQRQSNRITATSRFRAREKIAKAQQKMPCNGNAIVAPPQGKAEAREKVNTQMGVEDVHQPPS